MKVLLPVRARHKLSQSFFKDFALEREILVRWLPNVGALASAGNFLLKSAFLPFSFPSGDDVCLPAHGDWAVVIVPIYKLICLCIARPQGCLPPSAWETSGLPWRKLWLHWWWCVGHRHRLATEHGYQTSLMGEEITDLLRLVPFAIHPIARGGASLYFHSTTALALYTVCGTLRCEFSRNSSAPHRLWPVTVSIWLGIWRSTRNIRGWPDRQQRVRGSSSLMIITQV